MDIIYLQERFYGNADSDCIYWLYYNSDAICGDQFVCNCFDLKLLKEAISESISKTGIDYQADVVFDYIEGNCKQYLYDVGTEGYGWAKGMFESTPIAIGISDETIIELLIWFSNHQ